VAPAQQLTQVQRAAIVLSGRTLLPSVVVVVMLKTTHWAGSFRGLWNLGAAQTKAYQVWFSPKQGWAEMVQIRHGTE